MDFFDAINRRYSYRGKFKSDPVPNEHIKLILEAGISAPTGMHITTTHYIAVTDKDLIKKLGRWVPGSGVESAPFVLVLVTENFAKAYGVNFEVENYSAAAASILLAVSALGYATVWTDAVLKSPQVNRGIRETLNVPPEKTIRVVLPIGVPEKVGLPLEKESIEDVVVFQKYL